VSEIEPPFDEIWDAGDMSCGELVVTLRRRLKEMPGRVLKLVATDLGAPEDLAAFCGMTRNPLLRHDPASASFWIRSRQDWA